MVSWYFTQVTLSTLTLSVLTLHVNTYFVPFIIMYYVVKLWAKYLKLKKNYDANEK